MWPFLTATTTILGLVLTIVGAASSGPGTTAGRNAPMFGASLDIPFERAWHDRTLAAVRGSLREEEMQAAFEEGRAMTIEQATDYALEDGERRPQAFRA